MSKFRFGSIIISSPVPLLKKKYRGQSSAKLFIKIDKRIPVKRLRFEVDRRYLYVYVPRGVNSETLKNFILYRALPTFLAEQKHWVMHASCVAIKGKAFVFSGLSGKGKSTLAFALSQSGFNFYSDEGVILEITKRGGVRVTPLPQPVRLKHLPLTKEKFSKNKFMKKTILETQRNTVASQKLSLSRLIYLNPSKTNRCSVRKLSAEEALKVTLQNSFKTKNSDQYLSLAILDSLSKMLKLDLVGELSYPHKLKAIATIAAQLKGIANS